MTETHSLKQYMKKRDYKAFVFYGSDGVIYNWELNSIDILNASIMTKKVFPQ